VAAAAKAEYRFGPQPASRSIAQPSLTELMPVVYTRPAEIPITAVAALNHERLRGWAKRYWMPDDTKRTKPAHPGHEAE
jgi:hypothetical protein